MGSNVLTETQIVKRNRGRVKLILSVSQINYWLCCLSFFFASWAVLGANSHFISTAIINGFRYVYFILAFLILLTTDWKSPKRKIDLIIALTPFIRLAIQRFWSLNGVANVGSTSFAMLCAIYALQSEEIKIKVYFFIKWFMVITSVCGIVCWISSTFHLGIPYVVVPMYGENGRDIYNIFGVSYYNYHIAYIYHGAIADRLCGLFNEPGWMGTFAAFCLIKEKFNFKKAGNIIILVAGVITFSLAFVLLVIVGFFLYSVSDWRKWILVIVAVPLLLYIVPNVRTGVPGIDRTLERMQVTIEGLSGDNRTNDVFDKEFSKYIKSIDLFLGRGSGAANDLSGMATVSIKFDLYNYGIIGMCMIYIPIFYLLYKKYKCKETLVFLICIAISQYQRANFFEVSNFLLILSAVSAIYYEKNNLSNKSLFRFKKESLGCK